MTYAATPSTSKELSLPIFGRASRVSITCGFPGSGATSICVPAPAGASSVTTLVPDVCSCTWLSSIHPAAKRLNAKVLGAMHGQLYVPKGMGFEHQPATGVALITSVGLSYSVPSSPLKECGQCNV